MEPVKALYSITTLEGKVLFTPGETISEENIDALSASRPRGSSKAWPILDYGSFKKDLLFFINSPPYDFIFRGSDGISEILDLMEKIKLTEPILAVLDYFEQYDFFTYRHMLTVFALTILVSRELIPDYRHRVSEAAYGPTHDFGKICVPLEILKKEQPLTRSELQHLRHHALAGYTLLRYYLDDPNSTAARVARDHHERRDLTGYPRGIELNDKVVEIVAVCDIYDALISKRPYRPESYDNRAALEILTDMAGKGQIGWQVVKVLVASNRRSRPKYSDTVVSGEKRGVPPADNCYGIITEDN